MEGWGGKEGCKAWGERCSAMEDEREMVKKKLEPEQDKACELLEHFSAKDFHFLTCNY